MTQKITKVDIKSIQKYVKEIDTHSCIMDKYIKDITTKLNEINNFTSMFSKKNNLYNDGNSIQLKLQSQLLNNEKDHITHMKKIFITNMFNELYDLSNNIILLISSFLNLEFKDKTNNVDILKQLTRIKPLTIIKMSDITDSVNGICKNLIIVYNNLCEFNDYVENLGFSIKKNNYHCVNIYASLKHKFNFILLEYEKYYTTLENILPYFKDLSENINKQLVTKYVLFFCLNETSSGLSSSPNTPNPLQKNGNSSPLKFSEKVDYIPDMNFSQPKKSNSPISMKSINSILSDDIKGSLSEILESVNKTSMTRVSFDMERPDSTPIGSQSDDSNNDTDTEDTLQKTTEKKKKSPLANIKRHLTIKGFSGTNSPKNMKIIKEKHKINMEEITEETEDDISINEDDITSIKKLDAIIENSNDIEVEDIEVEDMI